MGMKLKIYLGTPYTDDDEQVMEDRFEAVTCKTAELMNNGYVVFSPISSCHPIAKRFSLPRSWDYWQEMDRSFVEWCDEVWILMLDGWEKSKGVGEEVKIALELGKPIKYIKI